MAPSSRAWDSARATRSERLGSNISGTNTVADAATARRRASYDPGAGGASRLRNAGQHAVEALGAVANEEFEQTGIVEPRDRLVGQTLHPRIGRVNVFEAEPPGGGGIEIVEDVLILGPFDWFEVDKSGECRRVGAVVCSPKPGPAGMLVSWNARERRAVHEEIPVHAVAERPPMTVRRKLSANAAALPSRGQSLTHGLDQLEDVRTSFLRLVPLGEVLQRLDHPLVAESTNCSIALACGGGE